VTTTDSAQVTPTAGTPGGIQTAERAFAGARAPAAVRAERRAWLILWVAFATFCALVFAATKFAVDWVSGAEVNQSAGVMASRGLVLLSLPGSTEKTVLGARPELSVGTVLWLDRNTSADLQLFDDSKVKLLGGSTLGLSRMEVGRFINQHAVTLSQSSGAVRYETAGPVDVQVPSNTVIHLAGHGDYTVWLDGDITRVVVYGGEARIGQFSVLEGSRVDVDAQGQASRLFGLQTPLLFNADFAQHDQGWQWHDVPSDAKLDVIGERSWVTGPDDQGVALRVFRNSVNHEHGETGLVQQLDRNVTGFRHLYLRAWVRVDYADLSGGGAFGSEFPLMFRVKYEAPSEGSFIPWAVGVYYANPENRAVSPFLGVPWVQGEWKLYETDLMDTDASNVPYRLIDFAVMAQGHSYDARVAGISLVGE
jgi:hypothetical protein